MATFEAPDYIIGNSATITAQLSSVLTQLDQALSALEPAPNATTVEFNNSILLQDPAVLTTSLTLDPISISSLTDLTLTATQDVFVIPTLQFSLNAGGEIAFDTVGGSITSTCNNNFVALAGGNAVIEGSAGTVTINAGTDINLTGNNQVIITSVAQAIGITAGTNVSLNTGGGTGTGTVSLDGENVNSFGFATPICFTRERNDTFTYSSGGQSMDNVYQTPIAIPYQFFTEQPVGNYTSTKWKIDFALNCYSNTNVGDKGLALYFDFQDTTSTFTFTPNTYNGNFPYAIYQPQSSYGGGSGAPYQNFNWTDWCDFGALQGQTSSVLPLNMRLWFAGDSGFSCSFYMAITLTRTNLL